MDPGYQQVILRGVLKAAQERDYKVICYVASSTAGPVLDVTATHQLIAPGCVDGLVIVAPSLGWGTEADRNRILAPMQSIPMCFVALEVPEKSGISSDNQTGMAALVRHLVRDHRARHLAFVRGPELNSDSEERLDTFRRVLAEAGLTVNEKLILQGDFGIPSGTKAVDTLLGERQMSIGSVDAIVAANDGMAMGVLEGLEARGIRVPHQVSVTGFDDCDDSRYLRVPLTTVRQPMFEQGKLAVRALTEYIRSGEPQRVVLPTELVVRRSCGCVSGIGRVAFPVAGGGSRGTSFDSAFLERRQGMIAELLRVGRGAFGMLGSGWESKLLLSLVEQLKGRSPEGFRNTFDEMLQRTIDTGSEPATFHEIVTVLWRNFAQCAGSDADLRTSLESILDEARLTTAAAAQRVQGANHIKDRTTSREFAGACARLCASTSFEHFGRLLHECGPALGISHFDLALYPDGTVVEVAMRVLSYAERRSRLVSTPVRASEFPRLVLSENPGLSGITVTSLELEAEILGVVVMNLGAGAGDNFDPLRSSLSAAVKGAMIREQLKQLGGHC